MYSKCYTISFSIKISIHNSFFYSLYLVRIKKKILSRNKQTKKSEFQYYVICSHTGSNHSVTHNEIPAVCPFSPQ